MGSAIVRGLVEAGWSVGDLTLLDSDPTKTSGLPGTAVGPPRRVDADVLLVAVKPQDIGAALAPLRPVPNRMVLSIAAGVTTAEVEALLGPVPVVRAMPNTPALIGEGMAAICAGRHADDWHLGLARSILEAVGTVIEVPEEMLDAVTAVSGSGPAYLFGLAEWLEDAAVDQGFERDQARSVVAQTLRGAALLLDASDEPPTELRRRVTSPGGTTEAAFEVLSGADSASIWRAAIAAAVERSRRLGAREEDDE